MSEAKIKLQFKSVQDIWNFVQTTGATHFEINTAERTLVCDCNKADEELAIKKYSAVKLPFHSLANL